MKSARVSRETRRIRRSKGTSNRSFRSRSTFLLVIAILRVLGIETTSFAALIAMVGLAVATAWAGLLSNLVAGFFIPILQPFRVGDHISGGVVGKVHAIGLFATTIDTNDHVRIFVGNAKLFTDNIQNHSILTFVRVDYHVQIAPFDDADRVFNSDRQRCAHSPASNSLRSRCSKPMPIFSPWCGPTATLSRGFGDSRAKQKSPSLRASRRPNSPRPKRFLRRTP